MRLCTMKLLVLLSLAAVVSAGRSRSRSKWAVLDKKICVIAEKIDSVSETLQEHISVSETLLEHIKASVTLKEEIRDLLINLTDICSQEEFRPTSCKELLERGHGTSGLYTIYPETWTSGVKVYCDQETDGGGWIVFQRREDGSEDFFRNWLDYKSGFGDKLGEFWMGNNLLHQLTGSGNHELRIELGDFEDNTRFAKYGVFMVGPLSDNYRLSIDNYTGNSGESMFHEHKDMQFSTKDRDHDDDGIHCADTFKGGWWYGSCLRANLNGLYLPGGDQGSPHPEGIVWREWLGFNYSLRSTEMKFRDC